MKYSYFCDKCSKKFEVTKPMSESATMEFCRDCGAILRRIFNPLAHIWGKGGWDFDKEGLGDNPILWHKK